MNHDITSFRFELGFNATIKRWECRVYEPPSNYVQAAMGDNLKSVHGGDDPVQVLCDVCNQLRQQQANRAKDAL